MTVVTPKRYKSQNVKKSSLYQAKPRSPVIMSTSQMTRTGLFSTPVRVTSRPCHASKLSVNMTKFTPGKMLNTKTRAGMNNCLDSKTAYVVRRELTVAKHTPVISKYIQEKSKTGTKSNSMDHISSLHPVKRQLYKEQQHIQVILPPPVILQPSKPELVNPELHSTFVSPRTETADCAAKEIKSTVVNISVECNAGIIQPDKRISDEKTDFNHNIIIDCIVQHKKKAKKSRKRAKCSCIFCVLEASKFSFSTESLFKSCVEFLLRLFSYTYIKCKKYAKNY